MVFPVPSTKNSTFTLYKNINLLGNLYHSKYISTQKIRRSVLLYNMLDGNIYMGYYFLSCNERF